MTLRAVIVDDEHLARRGLVMRLANIDGVEVVAECANGLQAIDAVSEHEPDLLFLDIEMPGMTGFQVIENLQADIMPMVVFVTAYNDYAVEAFKINAVDYVLKPLEEERLRESVERASVTKEQQLATQDKARLLAMVQSLGEGQLGVSQGLPTDESEIANHDRLLIREGGEVQFIPVADIEWVDAAGDYMCVHAGGETHIMRITMKQLEAQLDSECFARVHRSTIVNKRCIRSAQSLASGEYRITLASGARLKVSRGHRDTVRALLGKTESSAVRR